MKVNTWNFIGMNGKVLKTVTCSTQEKALEKLKAICPKDYSLVNIVFAGKKEFNFDIK